MEEKRNDKSFLFAIIGVAVLVVAIIGSTYAYYVASASDSTTIKGTAAGAGLSLSVTKESTSASGNLIPLTNTPAMLTTAAKGYGGGNSFDATKSCIDKNGYSVCQIYKIIVKNDSTAAVTLNGGITKLEGAGTPNITCAVMASNVSVTDAATCKTANSLEANTTFTAGQTKTYYIIVYINNTNNAQTDNGVFNGTVTFTTNTGRLEATFS